MIFDPINLLYFVITTPIVLLMTFLLMKLDKEKNLTIFIIVLAILLFIVRIFLVIFSATIGIMPYLTYDLIFYTLLTIFGVVFTISFLHLEKITYQEIGWKSKNLKKSILYGLLAYLPLIAFLPLVLLLTGLEVSLTITWEKIILGIEFGLILGGFYEEVMFRGIIQNYLSTGRSEKFTIIATALIFTATHLSYLPFLGYGIYYLFVFIMAIILSFLRMKVDLIACAILHGGIVFLLILAV